MRCDECPHSVISIEAEVGGIRTVMYCTAPWKSKEDTEEVRKGKCRFWDELVEKGEVKE